MSKKMSLIIAVLAILVSIVFRLLDNAGRIALDSELVGFIFGFLIGGALILIIRGIFGKK